MSFFKNLFKEVFDFNELGLTLRKTSKVLLATQSLMVASNVDMPNTD